MKRFVHAASHVFILCLGAALGIYFLPVLVEPPGLTLPEVEALAQSATFAGKFVRNLQGSDFLHWGEGTVYVSDLEIVLDGKVAPGPDYKLYLSPNFVETKAAF